MSEHFIHYVRAFSSPNSHILSVYDSIQPERAFVEETYLRKIIFTACWLCSTVFSKIHALSLVCWRQLLAILQFVRKEKQLSSKDAMNRGCWYTNLFRSIPYTCARMIREQILHPLDYIIFNSAPPVSSSMLQIYTILESSIPRVCGGSTRRRFSKYTSYPTLCSRYWPRPVVLSQNLCFFCGVNDILCF